MRELNMTLKEKCDFHWRMLGINDTGSLKKFITDIFNHSDHQQAVLIELYKMLFPGWDSITEIKGYPEAGCDLWHFILTLKTWSSLRAVSPTGRKLGQVREKWR
jgi:hypothetical protein